MSIFEGFRLYKSKSSDRRMYASVIHSQEEVDEIKETIPEWRPKHRQPIIGDMLVLSTYSFHITTREMFHKRYEQER